jgi:hypothetical protein
MVLGYMIRGKLFKGMPKDSFARFCFRFIQCLKRGRVLFVIVLNVNFVNHGQMIFILKINYAWNPASIIEDFLKVTIVRIKNR